MCRRPLAVVVGEGCHAWSRARVDALGGPGGMKRQFLVPTAYGERESGRGREEEERREKRQNQTLTQLGKHTGFKD